MRRVPSVTKDRHRTLQASIDWSYELLSQDEQTAFRRLGVFVGGFTLSTAEALQATPEAVASLLDKSLVLGNIEVSLGDRDNGRRCFERSLALTLELGFACGIAFSLEGLARLAVEEQQPQRALVLAGAAEHRRRTVGIPLPAIGRAQMDGLLARARDALPEADVTAAFAHGQRLDDQALIAWLRTEQLLPSVQ